MTTGRSKAHRLPKAAIYVRASTDEQTVENQLPVLHQWAEGRGFHVSDVYAESESAWHAGHQRELSRLLMDAARRQFECVMVWSLDRLSREGSLAILKLIDRLRQYNVRVLSHQESWTEAPGELAELLYALTGWVARMESERRSERTKAGLARRKAGGKPLGRPPGSKDKKKRKRRTK